MRVETRRIERNTAPPAATCPVCESPLVKGAPRGTFSVRCRSCRCYIEIHVVERVDEARVLR